LITTQPFVDFASLNKIKDEKKYQSIGKYVFSFCFICCTNDDTLSIPYRSNALNRTWHLKSYGGGFSSQFVEYRKNDVIWNFDTINNTIAIRNNVDYFGPDSGVYPYEIRQDDENYVLFLNDSVQGILYVDDDTLFFDQGLISTFER